LNSVRLPTPESRCKPPSALWSRWFFQRVERGKLSLLWNELIQRYHYLGYRPLSGAQMRYLVWSAAGRLLAALGFGGLGLAVKPRDQHIGWNHQQRALGLPRIVNNARFLILPLGQVWRAGLADLVRDRQTTPRRLELALRLPTVLLESFVEIPRFTGASYRRLIGSGSDKLRVAETGKTPPPNRPSQRNLDLSLHPNFRQISLCPALNPSLQPCLPEYLRKIYSA